MKKLWKKVKRNRKRTREFGFEELNTSSESSLDQSDSHDDRKPGGDTVCKVLPNLNVGTNIQNENQGM